MVIEDEGIIINIIKFQESSLIVSCLLANYGLKKGLVRIPRKNAGTIIMQSNIVQIYWKARLEEHLGNYQFELITPAASQICHFKVGLYTVNTATTLVHQFLHEADPQLELFQRLKNLIVNVASAALTPLKNNVELLKEYALFELALLRCLGFGLDFSRCVVSGNSDNLKFVSPKSGCAVSQQAAEPYVDKLFILPKFLWQEDCSTNVSDIQNALKITGHFINVRLVPQFHKPLPMIRDMLIQLIG